MKIKLAWLNVLEKLYEHKTLVKAAQALHIGQPALSTQLKQLSEVVGVELLTQQGRYLNLTEAGIQVLKHYRLVKAELNKIQDIGEQFNTLSQGRVSLSFTQAVLPKVLQKLKAFQSQYPKINIDMYTQNRSALLKSLNNYESDFAILAGPPIDDSLIQKPFLSFYYQLLLPIKHPLAKKSKPINFNDLKNELIIIAEKHSIIDDVVTNFLSTSRYTFRQQYVSDTTSAIAAVKQNMGVSFVPSISVMPNENDIVCKKMSKLNFHDKYMILFKKEKPLSSCAHKLIAYLTCS